VDWERIDHTLLQRTVSRIAVTAEEKTVYQNWLKYLLLKLCFLGLSSIVNKVLALLPVNKFNPFV